MNTVKIKVEDTIFTANFFDNPTAIEIENLLPLKLTMKELLY
ncbi:cyclophilin-like fold protein [Staphylococcus delphini]